MTMRWSGAVAVVAILAALGLGVGSGSSASQSPPPAPKPLPVGVALAEPADSFLRQRVYTGTLVARRRSVLSFETGGKLLELLVDEGDVVRPGQPLGRLDTRRLSARLAQAKADLAASTARLRELRAGPRQQTIASARAELDNLKAQRDSADLRMRRRSRLVATQAVSREEYDEAKFDHEALLARVESARQQLDELVAGTRPEQIAAQEAQVAALEARLADLIHENDDAILLAPYAGRIARRRADEGQVVTLGEPVFELVEDSALEAWIGMPPSSAASLEVGQSTPVAIDDQPRNATVQSIRPELDPETRTQNVVLRLDQTEGLVSGRVVRITLSEPVAMSGYWAPTESLSPDRRGLWSLMVVTDEGVVATRPVEVLENDGDRSFIRGALMPGERILVEGAHRVAPGQRVTPVEKQPGGSSPG